MSYIIKKSGSLRGEILVPGDKSISHRAIILGSLSEGLTEIHHFLNAADCLTTIKCMNSLGIEIDMKDNGTVLVHGKGLRGLKDPGSILNTGNSGTTTRLLSAVLPAQNFSTEISGDDSINRRVMSQIINPLVDMGANLKSKFDNDCAPLIINPSYLHGINHVSHVADSQVKSAILFSALFAEGETSVSEPFVSRNHSEMMIKYFGGNIINEGKTVIYSPGNKLMGQKIPIPGDISSAAYMITAGLIVPNSDIVLKDVSINPSRSGFIDVVRMMGGNISISNIHGILELCADINVKFSFLHGITLEGEMIPRTVDEIPILIVLACYADGTTEIKGAADLIANESVRIEAMAENLTRMGADIIVTEDTITIHGGRPLKGAIVGTRLDHRIAMSLAIAALAAEGKTEIIGHECVKVSYPDFYNDLKSLQE